MAKNLRDTQTASESDISGVVKDGLFRSLASLCIKMATAGLTYLMFVVLSRAMGEIAYGQFAFGFALATMLSIGASMGQQTAILRYWPEADGEGDIEGAHDALRSGWALTLIGGLVLTLGLIVVAGIAGLLVLALGLQVLAARRRGYFNEISFAGLKTYWKARGRASRWFTIGTVVDSAALNVDVVLVGLFVATQSAGLYFNAFRTAGLMTLFMFAITLVIAPMVARHYHGGDLRKAQAVTTLCAWAGFVFSLVVFGIYVLFGDLVLSLFGETYGEGHLILVLLSIGLLADAATGPTRIVVHITDLNAHAVIIRLQLWTNISDHWDVRYELLKAAKLAFDADGIDIAHTDQTFPQGLHSQQVQ